MNKLPNISRAGITAVGLAATGALVLAGCGASNEEAPAPAAGGESAGSGETVSGTLAAGGASSQESAVSGWQRGFQIANPEATINYEAAGSGAGRTGFIDGTYDAIGTDAYLDEEELAAANERCGGSIVELPLYISPIAVTYNLPGVDALNLTPSLIAQIFNQQIASWDDPAIAEVNPDAELPATPITVVNRSDESGTTENFVEYLSVAAPEDWTYEVSGDWPVPGGEAAAQTQGVISAVTAGEGSIGYADLSAVAENPDLGIVAVGVGEEFVEASPEAAAAVVEASTRVEGRSDTDFAYDLRRDTTESGTYPIVLVSYSVACSTYEDAETADLVKAYFSYIASEEGQQAAVEEAGNAPISDSLREMITPAIEGISAG